ncbi:hypothetical protein M422DRAFT_185255 [Sphaerobolus stellatus SS14]|uniref:Uncharacterized protein n=1 Tax=Sphaerobolus stellatus (strain SS14) TaxID=990650 RepID=A0A0C9UBE5_SPHS4|nr:hypothetical protein M422DRAFT_185255 [Sphaerobolus stellatus SS14]
MAPSQGHISRNVHFMEGGKVVIASFLDTHEVMAWSIEPWKLVWRSMAFTRIGNSALSQDGEHLLVDNLDTGVDAYSLPHMVRKATYQALPSTRRFAKQVAFGARDTQVIYGSDSGVVHVFDFASADIFQTLCHHQCESDSNSWLLVSL